MSLTSGLVNQATEQAKRRVAIIGSGITGLSAAFHLQRLAPQFDITVFESSSRAGGVICSERRAGLLIESAADNFLTQPPQALNLCRDLGLSDELIRPQPQKHGALVLRRGQLLPIPLGFNLLAPSQWLPFLKSPILSPWGKLRAAAEYFIRPPQLPRDESLQSFVVRRFGKEMYVRLVQPLISSIYTADPTRLSVAATLARFKEMEQRHGSLIRGLLSQKNARKSDAASGGTAAGSAGARYELFASLGNGMGSLIDALVARLPSHSLKYRTPVRLIEPAEDGAWRLKLVGTTSHGPTVDAVIVATPAPVAAKLIEGLAPQISARLNTISYASCAIVNLLYKRQQIAHPLNAMGLVVPLAEKKNILSCSFSSQKYSGRAPEGTVLLRVFMGGACQSHLLEREDWELAELAEQDLQAWLGIRGRPHDVSVMRRNEAMPQYHVGHLDHVAEIAAQLEGFPSLAIAGSSLYGAGIPACIQSGQQAAERIVGSTSLDRAARFVSKNCSDV